MADTKKTNQAAPELTTLEQLQEKLATLKADQLEALKSHKQGDLVNPHVLTTTRKEIARTLTAINAANRASQEEEK